jgi:hypothetical protein
MQQSGIKNCSSLLQMHSFVKITFIICFNDNVWRLPFPAEAGCKKYKVSEWAPDTGCMWWKHMISHAVWVLRSALNKPQTDGCWDAFKMLLLTLWLLLFMQRMKNGLAWLSVSMRLCNDCWNWAETVRGCFLAFPSCWLPQLYIWVRPANVFTLCKFFKPFFPRSLGLKDLFFLYK